MWRGALAPWLDRALVIPLALILALGVSVTVRRCSAQPTSDGPGTTTPTGNAVGGTAPDGRGDATDAGPNAATSLTAEADGGTVVLTGDVGSHTADDLSAIVQELDALHDGGIQAGVTVTSLDGSITLTYQQDQSFYAASTIKAPYACAVLEEGLPAGTVSLTSLRDPVSSALLYSDNESYKQLRDSYGDDVFLTWLQRHDVSMGTYGSLSDYARDHYPFSTPEQLTQMWRAIWAFVSSDAQGASYLKDLLARREESPIADALGPQTETYSKAGWYPETDGSDAAPASNDAGVVIHGSDSTSYVISVMSTAPSELDKLKGLISAIDHLMNAGGT